MHSIESPAPRTLPLGQQVQQLRQRRGLSRRGLADIVGRSEEWMRLVESGKQRLDSVELILRMANALHIQDFRELVSLPYEEKSRSTPPDRSLPQTLERILLEHPAALATDNRWPTDMPDEALGAAVADCLETWTGSPTRYSRLQHRLPVTMAVARYRQSSTRTADSTRHAIDVYHVGRLLLSQVGAHEPALMIADRATELAATLENPQLRHISTWHLASALLHGGAYDSAVRYALSAADRLHREAGSDAESAYLWGAFQLVAALAAARAGNAHAAGEYLSRVATVTSEYSPGTAPSVEFGAVEIGLARMEIALANADHSEVLRLATAIDPTGTPAPVTTVARYHIVVARSYAAAAEFVAATLALQQAADCCPEELRYDRDAHRALQHLVRGRHGKPSSTVLRLARLAQLT